MFLSFAPASCVEIKLQLIILCHEIIDNYTVLNWHSQFAVSCETVTCQRSSVCPLLSLPNKRNKIQQIMNRHMIRITQSVERPKWTRLEGGCNLASVIQRVKNTTHSTTHYPINDSIGSCRFNMELCAGRQTSNRYLSLSNKFPQIFCKFTFHIVVFWNKNNLISFND